ncbi:MAG: anti-sigma F factor [Defluviitaleaceae bacterium]|nr:anti-sigma F factor [Defluviitaleaceae bacterium]
MNHVSITMDSRPENIAFGRVAVAGFIAPLDPSVDEVSDIKTAVSEAVTNAIIHGYPEEGQNPHKGTVRLNLSVNEGRTITIEVADDGVGIADIKTAREPLFTTKAELERSGLGFTVMESFMDSVTVESTPGQGTTITLAKTLASRE